MEFNFKFLHKKDFLNHEQVRGLNSKFDDIYLNKSYTAVHENVIQLNFEDLNREPVFDNLGKEIKSFFNQQIEQVNLNLSKLWLVCSENKHTNPTILPYIPHFDKHRYLKAMVYLHDVTNKHGPIHLGCTSDNANIEHRRKNLPDNYKSLSLNTIDDIDIDGEMIPMVGCAGDIIFFDTNTAHKAGIVSKGYMRRVLRFDFEIDIKENKSSLLQKIFGSP
jgi:hypothetical protein